MYTIRKFLKWGEMSGKVDRQKGSKPSPQMLATVTLGLNQQLTCAVNRG